MDDLISREALLNDLSYCAPELWQDEEYVKAKIMKQPAVDAVPVVRCRDCARAELRGVQIEGDPDEAELYCTEWADQVGAWEYCSRGRRKGETE